MAGAGSVYSQPPCHGHPQKIFNEKEGAMWFAITLLIIGLVCLGGIALTGSKKADDNSPKSNFRIYLESVWDALPGALFLSLVWTAGGKLGLGFLNIFVLTSDDIWTPQVLWGPLVDVNLTTKWLGINHMLEGFLTFDMICVWGLCFFLIQFPGPNWLNRILLVGMVASIIGAILMVLTAY
ncbi:MAG: hypothetical protein Q8P90_03975 [bacterium]|nr:hypothetical protein [bacterium]